MEINSTILTKNEALWGLPDRTVLVLFFLLIFTSVFGQEYGGEYGELPEATLRRALEMETYESDSSAGALLLYDFGEVEITYVGTNLSFLRRIKILNKNALSDWADVTLLVQKLGHTKIYGFTTNLENGQVVKTEVGESQILKTSFNKYWDQYAFTMPNVRQGAVIEYTWQTVLDFYTLPTWRFQESIPVLWSEYDLKNQVLSFRADLSGALKVDYQAPKGRKPHRWTVSNSPAFKTEPYMPNSDRLRSQVDLWSHSQSWETAVESLWLKRYFKPEDSGMDFLLPIAREIGGGLSVAPRDRIKNLVAYVKNKITWDGTKDYLADDPEKVLKRKKGSSGDINLILASLLAKAGIKVNPVLISTRDNGSYHEDIPSLQQFNYLICQTIIETDTLYVDATEQNLRYDALPLRCLNQRGLCVTRERPYWVDIKPSFKDKVTVDADFTLQDSGELNGMLKITTDGYAGHIARKKYLANKEKYHVSSINGTWQINDMQFENEKEYDKPFIESYNLAIASHTNVAGDVIYINPFLALTEESNPFKADKRTFPIEYALPEDKTFLCKITIPEGFVVQELPKSKVMLTHRSGIKYAFSFSQSGRQINILTRLQINRTFFDPEEYNDLKEFYALVIAKKAEQIVLRKQ
jgi:hypothetical protein